MIDRFADRGHADLVGELAHELPALVIFRMLGIPDEDVPQVKEWAQSRVYMNFGDAPLAGAGPPRREPRALLALLPRARRRRACADPQDDLPGDLARIYLQGDQTLTPDEIAGLVYGQLTAGHETTTALLANGLKELLAQRPAWEAVCADPEQIPAAVEEMLRISAPVFTWKRLTKRPVTVGGVDLPAGTNLLLLLGSANHDEHVFPEPDRIDLERENALAPPGLRAGHPLLPGRAAGPAGGQGRARGAHPAGCPASPSPPTSPLTTRPTARSAGPAHVAGAAGAPSRRSRMPRRCATCGDDAGGRRRQGREPGHAGRGRACRSRPATSSRPPRSRRRATSTACASGSRRRWRPWTAATWPRWSPDAARDPRAARDGPAPGRRRARDPRRLPRRSVTTSPSRCARARARRTRPRRASPASRTPTCGSSARTPCSSTCSGAGPASTRRARCPIAMTTPIPEEDVSMAVVVQRMVDARAAGVAMTLDPLTGDRTTIVIEAALRARRDGGGRHRHPGPLRPWTRSSWRSPVRRSPPRMIELVADDLAGGASSSATSSPTAQLQPALELAPR